MERELSSLSLDELREYKSYIVGVVSAHQKIKRSIDKEIKSRLEDTEVLFQGKWIDIGEKL